LYMNGTADFGLWFDHGWSDGNTEMHPFPKYEDMKKDLKFCNVSFAVHCPTLAISPQSASKTISKGLKSIYPKFYLGVCTYLMLAIPMQTASIVQLDHFKSGGYGSDL